MIFAQRCQGIGVAVEQGDEADEAWPTSELRSLSPVLGRQRSGATSGGDVVGARPDGPVAREVMRRRAAKPGPDRYEPTWVRLRNARGVLVVAGTTALLAALLSPSRAAPARGVGEVVSVVLFLAWGMSLWVLWRVRCPRCSKRFTFNGGWSALFTSRCCWCGLEQWSPSWLDDSSEVKTSKDTAV